MTRLAKPSQAQNFRITRPWEGDPDYFTRNIYAHNFPPGFVSQLDPNPGDVKRREAAVRGRETQLRNGHTGSLKGLSKKSAAVQPQLKKALVSA